MGRPQLLARACFAMLVLVVLQGATAAGAAPLPSSDVDGRDSPTSALIELHPYTRSPVIDPGFVLGLPDDGHTEHEREPEPGSIAQDDPFAAVDACLQQEMLREGHPGASMAIAVDGELAHATAFGVRRRGAPERVNTETLFRINSTTKMVGAAAVMQQVERSEMDLQAPITDYVSDLAFAEPWSASDLTLHNLLANAGAMPDPYIDYSLMPHVHDIPAWHIDLAGWASRLHTMHLYAPPGSFWNYSSPNFSIAGLALERVTGMRWEDYVVENLFRPAGMHRATFDPETVVESGNYANGHYQERVYEPADYQRPYAYPGGGAYATPSELIAWAVQLMDEGGEILSADSVEAMTTRHYKAESLPWAQRSGYGYGIFIEDFRRIDEPSQAVTVFHHPGNGRGQGTELYWLPEEGFAIATLINQHGTMRTTVDCALRELVGIERAPSTSPGPQPRTWDRHAGSYAMQDVFGNHWLAQVERQGGQLLVHYPDWHVMPVVAEAIPDPVAMAYRFHDTFAYRYDTDRTVTFEPGGADPDHSGWLRHQYLVGQRLGKLPSRLDIEGRGCARLELESGFDVESPKVTVHGLVAPLVWSDQAVAQEDAENPSSSRFRIDVEVDGDLGYLAAWLAKESDDVLGMYLMQDQDGDGVFAWPDELVERLTGLAGQAMLVAERKDPGPYQLWVHGQQVSGAGSRFRLDLVALSGDDLRVEGLPERFSASETANFEVCAEPSPGATEERIGIVEIDFGAPGALGRVPVYWRPGAAPPPATPTLHLPWLSAGAR